MYTYKCDCRSKTLGSMKTTKVDLNNNCLYCKHAAFIEIIKRFNLTKYVSQKEIYNDEDLTNTPFHNQA